MTKLLSAEHDMDMLAIVKPRFVSQSVSQSVSRQCVSQLIPITQFSCTIEVSSILAIQTAHFMTGYTQKVGLLLNIRAVSSNLIQLVDYLKYMHLVSVFQSISQQVIFQARLHSSLASETEISLKGGKVFKTSLKVPLARQDLFHVELVIANQSVGS